MSDANETRTVFEIPAENFSKFEQQMAVLSRRSVKITGEEIPFLVFSWEERVLEDGLMHRVYQVLITSEPPRVDGWGFVARLDHSNETGNIIRAVPNTAPLPERFRTCPPDCDHCRHKRYRRDTFVLRNDETGEFKQVGSSCLVDFFGHDVTKLAKRAELLGYAVECAMAAEERCVGGDLRWIEVSEFLAHCAWAVRTFGWVSSRAAYENETLYSTRDRAWDNMRIPFKDRAYLGYVEPSEDDRARADAAIDWARSLADKESLSDYEHNIHVIANAVMMEYRSLGLAASIITAHDRKLAQDTQRRREYESQHVGVVGQRMDFEATVIDLKSFPGSMGTTFLYRFRTGEGNVLTWFASRPQGLVAGQRCKVRGTVAGHETRNNKRETKVTRCKVDTLPDDRNVAA